MVTVRRIGAHFLASLMLLYLGYLLGYHAGYTAGSLDAILAQLRTAFHPFRAPPTDGERNRERA